VCKHLLVIHLLNVLTCNIYQQLHKKISIFAQLMGAIREKIYTYMLMYMHIFLYVCSIYLCTTSNHTKNILTFLFVPLKTASPYTYIMVPFRPKVPIFFMIHTVDTVHKKVLITG